MGTKSRTCPACGLLVIRTHRCRVSALIPTTVPARKVAPSSSHPAGRARRVEPCPDHPAEPITYCRLCELEAVAPPAAWRPSANLIEDRHA